MPATLRPHIWHPHFGVGHGGRVRSPQTPVLRYGIPAVALALLVGVGTWIAVDRLSAGTNESAPPASIAVPIEPFSAAVTVTALQSRLRAAGYSIPVTGVLDPVTRSAAADFLTPGDFQALGSSLPAQLTGTVLTMRNDVGAWNSRFGADRHTRLVERPLIGPGGQLDSLGNVRQPSIP